MFMCVYISAFVNISAWECTCMHRCMCVSLCGWTWWHCVFMQAHVQVPVFCVHICVQNHVHTCFYIHAWCSHACVYKLCVYIDVHMYMLIYICICICVSMRVHVYVCVLVYECMHLCIEDLITPYWPLWAGLAVHFCSAKVRWVIKEENRERTRRTCEGLGSVSSGVPTSLKVYLGN